MAAKTTPHSYTLEKRAAAQPLYFVKVGTYHYRDNARKEALAADYPLQIIRTRDYYSLVSEPFHEKNGAKVMLQKLRKKYHDAYIITLYRQKSTTKQKRLPRQKSVPQTKRPLSLFSRAIQLYRHNSLEEALVLFDRILIEEPENDYARNYYAKTLMKLGFYDDAEREFQKVHDTALKNESCRYLRQIAIHRSKAPYKSWFAVGLGYDDNINLTTDKNTTQYGPYLLQNDTHKTKSSYATAAFALSHTKKVKDLTLYTTLYSYNELLHSATGNNLNFFDLSTSLIKKYHRFSLVAPVGANIAWLDGKQVSRNIYTAPAILYQASRHLQLKTSLLLNDNHTAFAKNRDYLLIGGGAGIRYKKERWQASADTGIQRYDAKEHIRYDIAKNLFQGRLSAGYNFKKQYRLALVMGYEAHRFTRRDPVMGYKRRDTKSYYALSLTRNINPKKSVTATYRYTDNRSNINTYSYTKNNYTLTYKQHF